MEAGIIGLGNLGMAIAKRLISEGIALMVWNRTRGKAIALGAETADSPADLISGSSVLFMNLFDSAAVEEVITGDSGLLKGECRGKIIIDTTTNHFRHVSRFHEILRANGTSYLESPVLGSVVPASHGALTVLVSGERDAFDLALPYLRKAATFSFLENRQTLRK